MDSDVIERAERFLPSSSAGENLEFAVDGRPTGVPYPVREVNDTRSAGSTHCWGDASMWMQYRDKLRMMARRRVPEHLRDKLDTEDLVQMALMRIHQAEVEFVGRSESEVQGYLSRTLTSTVLQEIRKYDRSKRCVVKERSAPAFLELHVARRASELIADHTSPSTRARRNEQSAFLARAMADLPEVQRRAIELHYLHHYSVSKTAEQLGIPYAAAAGQLRRGLDGLRGRLRELIT